MPDDRFYVYDRASWGRSPPPPPKESLAYRVLRWVLTRFILKAAPEDLGGPVTFEIRAVPDPAPEARPPIEVRADNAEEAQAKHDRLAAVYDDLAATPPVGRLPYAVDVNDIDRRKRAAVRALKDEVNPPPKPQPQTFGRPYLVSDDVIRRTVLNDRPQRESRDFVSDLVWYAALNSFESRHDADDNCSTASSYSAPDPYSGGGGMFGGAGASDSWGDSTDSGGTDFSGGDDT